jgi:hypothetical protein
MPAKNTAVNVMILATAVSFLIYRRANKIATVPWIKAGNAAQLALYSAGIINAASVPQVATTIIILVASITLDSMMYRGAGQVAPLRWGRMPERSQYALFLIAVSFTWLMGLMGYIRSGLRQHWHVTGVFRDNSVDAFTPTLGFAANVVSVAAILFLGIVIFVFWLSELSGRKTEPARYWKETAA